MDINFLQALERLQAKLLEGEISTQQDAASELNKILEEVNAEILQHQLPRVATGEPFIAEKYNYFTERLQSLLGFQGISLDILKSMSILDFNYAKLLAVELENKTAGLWDTFHTLQFYMNSPVKDGVREILFNFKGTQDRINEEWSEIGKRLTQKRDIGLTLPVLSEEFVEPYNADLLGDGFYGNFHTVEDGVFVYEKAHRSFGPDIIDASPESWIEYERYQISTATFAETKGYGFGFSDIEEEWAAVNVTGVSVDLVLKMHKKEPVNMVVLDPAKIYPEMVIKSVVIDRGDGDLISLSPTNLIITPEISEHRYPNRAGKAVYIFEDTAVEKVIFKMEQRNSYPCTIGHIKYTDLSGNIIQGPLPVKDRPHMMNIEAETKDWIRTIEFFPAKRFAIGISDVEVLRNTYSINGFIISDPIAFDAPIDRVSIETNEYVPSGCSIQYSLSFDGGTEWVYFKPLGSSMRQQVIAVNDRRPGAYEDSSTIYVQVSGEPTELLLKIEMETEKDGTSITPLLRECKLKVTTK